MTQTWKTVVAAQTRIALSATPTPTVSITPTITPTYTPRPTSTLWRIEPRITPLSRSRTWRFITDQYILPDNGLGKRLQPQDFSDEQKQTLRTALLAFLEQNYFDTAVDTTQFFIVDALELDWDQDGQTEIAFLYSLGGPPFMRSGLAMTRGEQILNVAPEHLRGDYVKHFILRALPLSREKTALFLQLLTTTAGSGAYPRIEQRIYLWRQNTFQPIWKWGYNGGGRVGTAASWGNFEQLRFLSASQHREAAILLSRSVFEWASFDNPGNYLFYSVSLPGELFFSWDEQAQAYRLTHFYDGARLIRIRPTDFIVHAPHFTYPLALDGLFYDWYQVEYSTALDGYGHTNWLRSAGLVDVKAAFDQDYLYLFLLAHQKTPIWLAFDTNLQGDFEHEALDDDDLLIQLTLASEDDPPSCHLQQAELAFPRLQPVEAAALLPIEWDAFCNIELRLPLDWLGLSPPLVARPGYALRPRLHPEYDTFYIGKLFTEYYPRPGKVIGFAAIGDNLSLKDAPRISLDYLPFNPQNPATWGTLIFIADR